MFPKLKQALSSHTHKEKTPIIQPQPLYPTYPGAYGPVLPNPNLTTQPIFENIYPHSASQYKYIEIVGQNGRKIPIPYHAIQPNNHYPQYLTSQIINDPLHNNQPKSQSPPLYIQPRAQSQPQLQPQTQTRAAGAHMENVPQPAHRPAFIPPPAPPLNTNGK